MRRVVVIIILLLSLAFAFVRPAAAEAKTPQSLMNSARAQYEAKDFPAYLASMRELVTLRPSHPIAVFNLAGAYALNHDASSAAATLQRLVRMRAALDVAAEHDFDPVRSDPAFQAAATAIEQLRVAEVGKGQVAFRLGKGLITEGIAHDPKSGAFFVTSVRQRKIFRVTSGGSRLWYDGSTGTRGFNGIAVDAKRRLLWVCAATSPRVEGTDPKAAVGNAALLAIDLDSAKLKKSYEPAKDGKAFFDDLSVADDGTVYVSDSSGAIYRLRPQSEQVELFEAKGVLRSPQGSALSANQRFLYVSDYAAAISVIDLSSGDVASLALPEDFPAYGIDGLDRIGSSLLAIQNGFEPHRLLRIDLAADGLHTTGWKVLEANHPLMDEPTLGVAVGRDYYWLGASQGNKFDADPPKLDQLHEAVIYRTRM